MIKTIFIDMGGVIKVDGGEEEIEGGLKGIRELQLRGYNVVIFTTHPEVAKNWFKNHNFDVKDLEITNIKRARKEGEYIVGYVDDLAFNFTNWNNLLNNFI